MALGVPTGPSDLSGLDWLPVLGLSMLGGGGCSRLCQGRASCRIPAADVAVAPLKAARVGGIHLGGSRRRRQQRPLPRVPRRRRQQRRLWPCVRPALVAATATATSTVTVAATTAAIGRRPRHRRSGPRLFRVRCLRQHGPRRERNAGRRRPPGLRHLCRDSRRRRHRLCCRRLRRRGHGRGRFARFQSRPHGRLPRPHGARAGDRWSHKQWGGCAGGCFDHAAAAEPGAHGCQAAMVQHQAAEAAAAQVAADRYSSSRGSRDRTCRQGGSRTTRRQLLPTSAVAPAAATSRWLSPASASPQAAASAAGGHGRPGGDGAATGVGGCGGARGCCCGAAASGIATSLPAAPATPGASTTTPSAGAKRAAAAPSTATSTAYAGAQRQQQQQQRQQQQKQQNSSSKNRSNSIVNRLDVKGNSNDNIRTAAGTTAAAATSTEATTTGTTASSSARTAAAALTVTRAAVSIRTSARATKTLANSSSSLLLSQRSNRTIKGCRRTTDSSCTRCGGGCGSERGGRVHHRGRQVCPFGGPPAAGTAKASTSNACPHASEGMRDCAPGVVGDAGGQVAGQPRARRSCKTAASAAARGGRLPRDEAMVRPAALGRGRPSRSLPRRRRSRKSAAPAGARGRPPRSTQHRLSRWLMQPSRRGTSGLCRPLPSMRHRGVRRLLCRCLQRSRRWGAP